MEFICKTQVTTKTAKLAFRFIRKKVGKKYLERGCFRTIQTSNNHFHNLYQNENLYWCNLQTSITYCKDLNSVADLVTKGRKIKKPYHVLSADYGQGETIVTMSTFEISETTPTTEVVKSGGTSRTLIVCAADQVMESRDAAHLILVQKLKLPQFSHMTVLVLDLKMVCLVTGLSGGLPTYGCPYCLGRRTQKQYVVDGRKKIRHEFPSGPLRSHASNFNSYTEWIESGANEKRLNQYFNVKNEPVQLVSSEKVATPFLNYLPPEPLHHLLGVVNDIMERVLTVQFGQPFQEFRDIYKIKAENMVGGKYNGPNCKKLLGFLDELAAFLGPDAEPVVDYLNAFKAMYDMYVARDLDPSYSVIIQTWRSQFDQMSELFNLSMTNKTHNLYYHLEDYINNTKGTLHMVSGEGVESTHAKYRKV